MTTTAPAPIIDNSSEWVSKQIADYLRTDGVEPVFRGGVPLALVTTQGRKSGEWRRTALICLEDDGRYLIVASLGGADKHPVWYLNLLANTRVWLQVGAESFWTVARVATPDEKPPLWDKLVGVYADYADYQVKTEREIPVVILEREQ